LSPFSPFLSDCLIDLSFFLNLDKGQKNTKGFNTKKKGIAKMGMPEERGG
jgi:hypothetical protein